MNTLTLVPTALEFATLAAFCTLEKINLIKLVNMDFSKYPQTQWNPCLSIFYFV